MSLVPIFVPPPPCSRHVDRKRKSQRRRVPTIRRKADPFFDVVLRFENDLLIAVEACRALAPDGRAEQDAVPGSIIGSLGESQPEDYFVKAGHATTKI